MRWSLTFVAFYVGWFACVVGAAHGHRWWGPALIGAFVVVHVRASTDPRAEVRVIAAVAVFGFAFDTLLASAGLYAFTHTSAAPWLAPPWAVALWALFATTLDTSLSWLGRRPLVAAALGALSGPASYAAGARLGAIELGASAWRVLAGIALAWAFVTPVLFRLDRTLRRSAPGPSSA